MSDWRNTIQDEAAPSAATMATQPAATADWRHSIQDESLLPEMPSITDTARGFAQGISFGSADELTGLSEAALDTLLGKNAGTSFNDLRKQHTDESRAAYDKAQERSPILYGAGQFAGGIAPAVFTGGGTALPSVAEMALTGGITGAAQGYFDSKDSGSEAIKDALVGGLVGTGLGASGEMLTNAIKPGLQKFGASLKQGASILDDIPSYVTAKQAYAQGKAGRRLVGESAEKSLGQELLGMQSKVGDVVSQALDKESAAKMEKLLSPGPNVSLSKWQDDFKTMAGNLKKDYGQDSRVVDDISKISDIIERSINGDKASKLAGKGIKQAAEAAEKLRSLLGSRGTYGSDASLLKTREGSELINRLVSPLKRNANLADVSMQIPKGYQSLTELVNASRPGLDDINQNMHRLLKAKELVPDMYDIAKLEKSSLSGASAGQKVENFLDLLPKETAAPLKAQFQDLSIAKKVSDKISAPSLVKNMLGVSPSGAGYGGANLVGLVSKSFYEADPLFLASIGKKISALGSPAANKVASVLQEAANKDQFGRKALLFTLQQNPAYRKILEEAGAGSQKPE